MVITELHIENIKGLQNFELKQSIQPNRPNILVAPNGFGKTSLAIAFKSLKNSKLDLDESSYYNGDNSNKPILRLKLSTGENLEADDSHNSISSKFDIYVINCQLKPKATAQRYGGRTIARASNDISPTVMIQTIPPKINFDYSLPRNKRDFGINGKLLTDISNIYSQYNLIIRISENINFEEFSLVRFKTPFNAIIAKINSIDNRKTAHSIKDEIIRENIIDINNQELTNLCDIIRQNSAFDNIVDVFLVAWQIIHVRNSMGVNYRKALAYANFLKKQVEIDSTLEKINPVSDRFEIKSTIKDRSLIIEWPKADMISNGQRDILTFISRLMECHYKESKACILVIDEFFDYLDDANLVAFQYYISTLIDSYRKNRRIIFPILLTHIDPNYLKHFCFNDKRLNICYLKNYKGKISDKMAQFIGARENLLIKNAVDTYYLHYHPNIDTIDITEEFKQLSLNLDWGTPRMFKKKVDRELRKYLLEPGKTYDPLAVCVSIRIKIEENAYNYIDADAHKQEFLITHGTTEKLNYAHDQGIVVPETYYLLGIIYNHPLHIAGDNDMSKQLSMKLENETIKSMIRHLWE